MVEKKPYYLESFVSASQRLVYLNLVTYTSFVLLCMWVDVTRNDGVMEEDTRLFVTGRRVRGSDVMPHNLKSYGL